MNSLILTLGHNSSAIYVNDGNIVAGYEEERLSGIKSDSAFPYKAIGLLREKFCQQFDNVFIGHWFTNGELVEGKYYDYDKILDLVPSEDCIFSLNHDFTHHDSHIISAEVFAKHYQFPFDQDTLGLVIDGFGTLGEAVSIYKYNNNGERSLYHRIFGYQHSIGLFYQYATLFLGMKMNNHEYKMLGYEAHIHEVLSNVEYLKLSCLINDEISRRMKILSRIEFKDTDPVVNKSALMHLQNEVFAILSEVVSEFKDAIAKHIDNKKIIISHFVQSVTEKMILNILDFYGYPNIIVSGGVFYNVKVNNLIANKCKNFCVFPLAGDQGAGLGVYQKYIGNLKFDGHFNFGKRFIDLDKIRQYNEANPKYQIHISKDLADLQQVAKYCLDNYGFVNIVGPSMEFGPRALGQTSTIAKPTKLMAGIINKLNDRTAVMPMAPMMTQSQYDYWTKKHKAKIFGSNEFMIMSVEMEHKALENIDESLQLEDGVKIEGAIHKYPNREGISIVSTCRPQIIDDKALYLYLCGKFGALINTSFNYHGVPIVFDADDIIYTHECQVKKAKELGIFVPTIIFIEG